MAESKNILILYITERSGHHSAALAIKKALLLKNPDLNVSCVNAFQYAFPFAERIIHKIYLTVIQRVPKIWESMYDNQKLIGRSQGIKRFIHYFGIKKIRDLIERFKPDVVVCTQAFPCGLVADYKRKSRSKTPLIGVLTDFAPHSFWVYEDVDHYIVPCEESRKLLIEKGISDGKIKTLGIPIDPKFAQPLDRQELFANYGLNAQVPVVMVMGGGHGLGPIENSLLKLDTSDIELQFIVICGLNKRLYNWIKKTRFKNRILTFRYTDQIERLMTVSSLIISKPGGITTAEALAKRLPMIILNPIPGQEKRNTHILIKNKAAVAVDSPERLLPEIKKIVDSVNKGRGIFSVTDRAHDLSKPSSSLEIAKFVLALIAVKG